MRLKVAGGFRVLAATGQDPTVYSIPGCRVSASVATIARNFVY